MLQDATVRVPGSTSNLGSGFDTLGLAVRRHLTARFEAGGGELVLRREGTLSDLAVAPEGDLLLRAFVAELARRGVGRIEGFLHVTSEIPVGRGLGTSAAAIVGGLLLAAAAAGEADPDRERLLQAAATLEGHGDNAAPAVFGGLRGVMQRPGGDLRALPLRLSPTVSFAFAAPGARVATADARRVLPREYPRATAVAALGRLAALLYGLAEGDGDALAVGFTDDVHVPYRLPLIAGGAAALEAAKDAGAWGATISGSGSGLVAVCPGERAQPVASAMAAAFRHGGTDEVITFPLEPELRGAGVLDTGASSRLTLTGEDA